jgi:hypothetical protein
MRGKLSRITVSWLCYQYETLSLTNGQICHIVLLRYTVGDLTPKGALSEVTYNMNNQTVLMTILEIYTCR